MGASTAEQARPLIDSGGRRFVVAIIAVAVAAFVTMALWLHGTRDPTAFDANVRDWLNAHTGHLARDLLLGLSDPILTIGAAGIVALVALMRRRWDFLTLAVAGPTIALLLSTYVLKPSINRLYGDVELISHGKLKAGYAFPSGHETGLASVTVLLAVLLLGSNRAPVRVKAAGVAALTIWTLLGAAGLVRAGYHYATDTIGGFLLGLVLVLAVALVVDQVAPRISSPGARSPSRIPGGA
ncbi:MAG: phosphatase PAP2 family protein [Jatrophihabitans sp.]